MREDLVRQLTRRRTRLVLGAMLAIPVLLAAIYVVRGAPEVPPGATPQLGQLADTSALAFTAFVMYLCGPLLLVAVAALFAGEAIAGEAAWGSLRYLLAAPVPRESLLLRRFGAALVLLGLALAILLGGALLAGWAAFGWHGLVTPVGGTIEPGAALGRCAMAAGYTFVTLVPFAALAILGSALLDLPLAAVATSLGAALFSQVLDAVPSLGESRTFLPTHHALAWTDLFVDPPHAEELAAGTLHASALTVAAVCLAVWRFARRDVLA